VFVNEQDKKIADDPDWERFLLFQECPTCKIDVNSYELLLSTEDWPLEHCKVLVQYYEWSTFDLFGEGFSVTFLEPEKHEHLLPDARREIATLLDCGSLEDFRQVDDVEGLVATFSEYGINLLELDGEEYSQRNNDGAITLYGVIVDEPVDEGSCDYIVHVSLWNGHWGLKPDSVGDLEGFAFGFYSTGMYVAIEFREGFEPTEAEMSKWNAIKDALAPSS
jgi:hypothetical protein